MYWLGLLTHLQADAVPYKSADCLRDLVHMYESATIDDMYDAFNTMDLSDPAVFTCIGVSGQNPPPQKSFEEANKGNLLSVQAAQSAKLFSTPTDSGRCHLLSRRRMLCWLHSLLLHRIASSRMPCAASSSKLPAKMIREATKWSLIQTCWSHRGSKLVNWRQQQCCLLSRLQMHC